MRTQATMPVAPTEPPKSDREIITELAAAAKCARENISDERPHEQRFYAAVEAFASRCSTQEDSPFTDDDEPTNPGTPAANENAS